MEKHTIVEKHTIGKSVFAQKIPNDEIEYIYCPDCGNMSIVVTDGSFYCERCNKYWEIMEVDYSLINVEVQEVKD